MNKTFQSTKALIKQPRLHGFTIVELLIAIVVIGILAAITIAVYTSVQNRAHNIAVESDLATFAKKMELFKASSSTSTYPTVSSVELRAADIVASKNSYDTSRNNFYYCTDGQRYAFGVVTKANKGYFLVDGTIIDSASASQTYQNDTCKQLDPLYDAADPERTVKGAGGYNGTDTIWQSWVK